MFKHFKTIILNFAPLDNNANITSEVWLDIVKQMYKNGVTNFVLEKLSVEKSYKSIIDFLEEKQLKYIVISEDINYSFINKNKIFYKAKMENLKDYKNENVLIKIGIEDLNINIKKKFEEIKLGKIIIDLENYCQTIHSNYWKNRIYTTNKNQQFSINDRKNLVRFSSLLLRNKSNWNIINGIDYLKQISNYGITQNWKCKFMNGFVINNDSSMSICKQKNFIKPISVYDIGEGNFIDDKKIEENFLKNTINTSQNCSGCFQFFKYDEAFWSELE